MGWEVILPVSIDRPEAMAPAGNAKVASRAIIARFVRPGPQNIAGPLHAVSLR